MTGARDRLRSARAARPCGGSVVHPTRSSDSQPTKHPCRDLTSEGRPQDEAARCARLRTQPRAARESVVAEDRSGRRVLLALRHRDRARVEVASRSRRRRPNRVQGAGARSVQPAGSSSEDEPCSRRQARPPRHVEALVGMAGRRPKSMQRATVAAALQRDLDAIAKTDPDLATGTMAASAMSLARTMDSQSTSAAGRSQCARALREITSALTARVSIDADGDATSVDGIDDLAARRDRRRRAAASTS